MKKNVLINLVSKIMPNSFEHFLRKTIRKHRIKKIQKMNPKRYEDYLSRFYFKYTKKKMDFENPITLTQKQQWMKLYDVTSDKEVCSDKYKVREVIKDQIGEQYLIPLIAIDGKDHFFKSSEIQFDKLPNKFVLKCNHGSHYNIIVDDKSKLTKKDYKNICKQLDEWLSENFAYVYGLELIYKNIEPCIIIEEFMSINDDLPDYKFMCFSGEVKYVWCDTGRYEKHRRTLYDANYNPLNVKIGSYDPVLDNTKPDNYEEMINIAKKLAGNHSFVRVDLYNINGRIYFGELTFSSGTGLLVTDPLEFDRQLGDLCFIDKNKRMGNLSYRYK